MAVTAEACATLPESVSYVEHVRERAYARWKVTDASAGPVVIVFQLDEGGNVVLAEVRSSPTPEAGEEMRKALLAGSPYEPMPEAARCLAKQRLRATFRVGGAAQTAETPPGRVLPRALALIVAGALALPVLLAAGVFWFLNRRREDQTGPSAETDVQRLQPGEEQIFVRARGMQAVEGLAALHGVLLFERGVWLLAVLALLDVAVLFLLWQRRNTPIVRVTSVEIESSPPLSPVKRLMTHELASWAATRAELVLRSVRGEEVSVALQQLTSADQKRLLALLRGLPLASSPAPPISARDIQRRGWRRMGWILGIVAVTVAAILWLALGARADAPAEPPQEAIVGTLPFLEWPEGNRIVVNLAPDGEREFRLMLDTGAEGSVLTPRYAHELGVNVRRVHDGEYQRATRLGRNLQFWVDTRSSESASRTGWEYGLLGGNFLGDCVLDLDFAKRRVQLIDADRWQVPSSVGAANEAVLPLRVMGNRPFAKLMLEGQEVDVLLDTGAPAPLYLSGASAKHAGFAKPPLARVDTAGVLGPIEAYAVESNELALGPFKFAPVPLVFSPHGAYNQAGSSDSVVGYDLLCHFHVRIDYPHKRLWLRREDDQPVAWYGQPWAAVRRAGVFASVGDHGIRVDGVLPDSPAAKLGMRAGDEIEFHGDTSRAKALEETLAAIERGDPITVVRDETEGEPPVQVELGGKKE